MTDTPTASPSQPLFVMFSDDGKHIRKWDVKPFLGATAYGPGERLNDVAMVYAFEAGAEHCASQASEAQTLRTQSSTVEQGGVCGDVRAALEQAYTYVHACFVDGDDAAYRLVALIRAALSTLEHGKTLAVPEGLRELSERATPGEWCALPPDDEDGSVYIDTRSHQPVAMMMAGSPHCQDINDAAFTVATVNFVRSLLASPPPPTPSSPSEGVMREALEHIASFVPKKHPQGRWSEGVSEWNRAVNYVAGVARAALAKAENGEAS